MLRGMTTSKCSQCGHRFVAMDIEWNATVFSVPMPCPKCNSIRTYSSGLFSIFDNKSAYKEIWEQMEKDQTE